MIALKFAIESLGLHAMIIYLPKRALTTSFGNVKSKPPTVVDRQHVSHATPTLILPTLRDH